MSYDPKTTTVAQVFDNADALAIMRELGIDPDAMPRSPASDQMPMEQAFPYIAGVIGEDVATQLNERLMKL